MVVTSESVIANSNDHYAIDAQLVSRSVHERRFRIKKIKKAREQMTGKCEDAKSEGVKLDYFTRRSLDQDNPIRIDCETMVDGPLPINCGIYAVYVNYEIKAASLDHHRFYPVGVLWTRNAPDTHDRRYGYKYKLDFLAGESLKKVSSRLDIDYWFKRNGVIKLRIYVKPGIPAFETRFKVVGCER